MMSKRARASHRARALSLPPLQRTRPFSLQVTFAIVLLASRKSTTICRGVTGELRHGSGVVAILLVRRQRPSTIKAPCCGWFWSFITERLRHEYSDVVRLPRV